MFHVEQIKRLILSGEFFKGNLDNILTSGCWLLLDDGRYCLADSRF